MCVELQEKLESILGGVGGEQSGFLQRSQVADTVQLGEELFLITYYYSHVMFPRMTTQLAASGSLSASPLLSPCYKIPQKCIFFFLT